MRRSGDRLIFNMGIPIPGKDGLYIEAGPWLSVKASLFLYVMIIFQFILVWLDHWDVAA